MAQVDYSTLPQPKLRCWIWIENLNIAGDKGCFSLKENFSIILTDRKTHTEDSLDP